MEEFTAVRVKMQVIYWINSFLVIQFYFLIMYKNRQKSTTHI
jgi:hypothetical protein